MIQLKPGIPHSSLSKSRKVAGRTSKRTAKRKKDEGLKFERVFSDPNITPFHQTEWEHRSAEITDDSGKVIFKQEEVEVPKSWTALATKIAVSKYFYGDIANGTDPNRNGRETSVRQLIHRVTRTITDWGIADGYFANTEAAENFYDDLSIEVGLSRNEYARHASAAELAVDSVGCAENVLKLLLEVGHVGHEYRC